MGRKRLLIPSFGWKPWGETRRTECRLVLCSFYWQQWTPGGEGHCSHTIPHFTVTIFLSSPPRGACLLEAAQNEPASEASLMSCIASPWGWFHLSDLRCELKFRDKKKRPKRKTKTETPVLSDAIAHLCQSSRGFSSNLQIMVSYPCAHRGLCLMTFSEPVAPFFSLFLVS